MIRFPSSKAHRERPPASNVPAWARMHRYAPHVEGAYLVNRLLAGSRHAAMNAPGRAGERDAVEHAAVL